MTDTVQSCLVCPPGRPRHADDGTQVCFGCSNRILRHLRELEEYLPTLQLTKARGSVERAAPGFRSSPPVNLDAVLHTDPRSDASDRHGVMADELGALGVVDSWVRVVVEELGITPPATAYLGLPLLRTNHAWITHQRWVDEYADDLRRVHAAVRAAAGDPLPCVVGKCLDVACDGDVYEEIQTGGARCARCDRPYDGLGLVKIQLAREAN